ncbi:MAG: redoxin domain-containing protein [Cyclobacteriaceae bacterium]
MTLHRLILSIIIVVCVEKLHAQDEGSYEINLRIEGLEDSVAYLGYHLGNKRYYQDTSLVSKQGEVSFSNDSRLKKGVYFLYAKTYYLEFLVNEQNFTLNTTKTDSYENMKIIDSPENEVFREFQLLMKAHQLKIRSLNDKLKTAASKADSVSVYEEAKTLGNQNIEYRKNLGSKYPDSYSSVLINLMISPKKDFSMDESLTVEERRKRYNEYKESFLSGIDFKDEGTLRAPVFHGRIMEFMDKVTLQNPDSVISSIDDVLGKSEGNDEMFRYWVSQFVQKYQKSKVMGLDKAFYHLAANYYMKGKVTWASDETIEKITEEMDFMRENQMGMMAPRLYLLDTLLDPISLRSIDADYTVLYFYSPNCGHCKKMTPVMLDVYHTLQPDGVEVLGVDVDTDIDKWKAFILEHQLDWINAADPFTRSNFRRQYDTRLTPAIYILDRDKKIIAKKLGVEQIEGFIRDRIKFDNREKL